jgi:hypothetical protein
MAAEDRVQECEDKPEGRVETGAVAFVMSSLITSSRISVREDHLDCF